jgi:hypothetical protein
MTSRAKENINLFKLEKDFGGHSSYYSVENQLPINRRNKIKH